MIFFNKRWHAENPKEAQELDKKLFKSRQKSREYSSEVTKEELIKAAEGNKKLPYFE